MPTKQQVNQARKQIQQAAKDADQARQQGNQAAVDEATRESINGLSVVLTYNRQVNKEK